MSGAILSRSTKSVVLGLGGWKTRDIWPLPWLKTVTKTTIFGFILHNDYSVIVEDNWSLQFSKFSSCLKSWSSRVIETLPQKAEVLSTFALSKVWYRAMVLPLPNKYALKFEKEISSFLWKGHLTNNVVSRDTVCLPKDKGGLGIPHVRIKCKSLFAKQTFRNIIGGGKYHYDFWLGKRLGIDGLESEFYHIKGRVGRETDYTPKLFLSALDTVSEIFEKGIVAQSDISEITTKELYLALLEELPLPVVQVRNPDKDWDLIWQRLRNGVLTPESKSILYLIVHERVGTRERGHRLMPGRFPSPLCAICRREPDTDQHRYLSCESVSQTWNWLVDTMILLEPSLSMSDDIEILRLNFTKGLRENALLWLLSIYTEIVEKEVVLKGHILDPVSVRGLFRQQKQRSRYMAIPDLGPIPGLDFEPRGVG